ncbi:GAF domain-containing sensor histidine kinase [Pseudarthrobacter sp. N5]|uniref:GAF domain-containing sensor histidine kinase n=1 Tax=Pseudarthrobacter sp. N5 TaxID=3418416 RepID=UPI003CE8A99D
MADVSTRTTADDELDRQYVLAEYGLSGDKAHPEAVPDAGDRRALDNLVRLAAALCGVPYGVVNIITADQQRQIAASGLEPRVCARRDSMCAQVFLNGSTTVVPDARLDPRVASNPFVTGEIASVRFYASVPLQTASGHVLGSLCVLSYKTAVPSAEQIAMLEALAAQVVEVLELQHRSRQLNQATEELRRSNKKLGEFAGRVSHDLRAPLTTILGYVELSEDDPGVRDQERAAEYLQRIGASGRRMLAMLENVLSYSRIGGAIRPKQVSLRAIVEEAGNDLGDAFAVGATVVCDEVELYADAAQLRILLQNLLGNALNYRDDGRPLAIRISGSADELGVTVRLADNGKGIGAEDRKRVLEPLVRLHRPGDPPGSGLGLATCLRIARSHGGDLTLDETPGGGTTADVKFPWARQHPER